MHTTRPTRRTVLQGTAAWAAAAAAGPLLAQTAYPNRPITIIEPFGAGGSPDIIARVLAAQLGPILGVTVNVDNRTGAGGALGSEAIARATPDGYTLGIATVSTLVSNPAVKPNLRYDPLHDFAHVTNLAYVPSLLVVNPALPVKTLGELVQLAKDKPGQVSFATPGIGTAGHILLEQFSQLAGVKFLHVPYTKPPQIVTDLIGGQVQVASDNLPGLLPHVLAGKLRAIAVRDVKRLESLPDVATYAEAGFAAVSEPLWFGLVAPAHTPKDVIDRVNAAARQAVASAPFQERLKALGSSSAAGTPEQFATQARTLLDKYKTVVKLADIKVE